MRGNQYSNPWTEDEDEFLEAHAGTFLAREIAERVGHSCKSVWQRASDLSIRLTAGNERGNYNRLPLGEGAFRLALRRIKNNAKKRNLEWKLSDESARKLMDSPCYYCGRKKSNHSFGNRYYGDYRYNGIDRLDNDKGYLTTNVVPSCRDCNIAKASRTYGQFIEWARRIVALRG